jgi:eukaryotic-like serine/threonine-protein kinase
VKPDNLFVTVDGQLKVVDFGFAKLKEGGITANGTTLGTVSYMAPEQALADPVDGRTDVYGLGVTLFHMLTGKLPFSDTTDARVVARHLHTAAPRVSSRREGLDPRIDQVVLAAMRKRPDHRYPSMSEMQEDVERLLATREGALSALALTDDGDYEAATPAARTVARHLRGLIAV